ncbi:MAG TPA: hypothetical protein VHY21_15840 [Pseudonocardiaceae bacterium]|nr:hypothetical protein [Pseudonocardiaceae bacterium]
MGPQYRVAAGSHLLEMLTELAPELHNRQHSALALARLGVEFHPQAAIHLREIITDSDATAGLILSAARGLANLGPDFHAEAVQEFHRPVDDPLVDGYVHAGALGQVIRLGPPHRGPAVDRLVAELRDRDILPSNRRWLARELVELGPEFHAEVTSVFLEIIYQQPNASVISESWGTLATLGTRFHEPAAGRPSLVVLSLVSSAYVRRRLKQCSDAGHEHERYSANYYPDF